MWRRLASPLLKLAAAATAVPLRTVVSTATMALVPHTMTSVGVRPNLGFVLQRSCERGVKKFHKYKLKTKSSVKKRFRLTGSGTFKRYKSGKSHINVNKGRVRLNKASKWAMVNPAMEKSVFKMMPGKRSKPKAKRNLEKRKANKYPRSGTYKATPPGTLPKPSTVAKGFVLA